MNSITAQIARLPLMISALVLVSSAALVAHPLLYTNFTHSMPTGVYLACNRAARVGDIVAFPSALVPHYRFHLPEYLLKRFAYGQGTRVRIDAAGVQVAGTVVAPRIVALGLAFQGPIPAGESLVLGENARSFDSRYFGFVPQKQLRPVTPLVIWSTR